MKFLLVAVPILLSSFAGHAQEELKDMRWYTAEVIVFANTSTAGVQEEHWPDDPGTPDLVNTVTLITNVDEEETLLPAGRPIEFQELPLATLANSLAALQRSSRYKVLEATAWRLPGLPKESAPPVLIKAGLRYLPDGSVAPPLSAEEKQATGQGTASATPGEETFSLDGLYTKKDVVYELEGKIGISLSRYLDVDADLVYRTEIALPDENNVLVDQFQNFRLKEYRRMKSKSIHFLDHPMFGMLIAIDRYEVPLPEVNQNIEQTSASISSSVISKPAPSVAQ